MLVDRDNPSLLCQHTNSSAPLPPSWPTLQEVAVVAEAAIDFQLVMNKININALNWNQPRRLHIVSQMFMHEYSNMRRSHS